MRISDWSSDVCSSDLPGAGEPVQVRPEQPLAPAAAERHQRPPPAPHRQQPGQRTGQQGDAAGTDDPGDRKSAGSGKSVSVRVDPGGRSIIKQTNTHDVTPTSLRT